MKLSRRLVLAGLIATFAALSAQADAQVIRPGSPPVGGLRYFTAPPTYLPTLPSNSYQEWYGPLKWVSTYSGPVVAACATAAADTPASTIDVFPDANGNPDYTAAIAAYGSTFDIYKWYSQTGTGNDAVHTTAALRMGVFATNAWGSLQPITSYRTAGGVALIPDTMVTARTSVTIVVVSAQRGAQAGTTCGSLSNTGSFTTSLAMTSDISRIEAFGNSTRQSALYGLITPCIKIIASGAGSVIIHRNDENASFGAMAATSMAGGAIGGIKNGSAVVATFRSSFEDFFGWGVISGQVSTADVTGILNPALKARCNIVTGATGQIVYNGDSIEWGTSSVSGINYPTQSLPYITSRLCNITNVSTPGKTLAQVVTEFTSVAGGKQAGLAKNIAHTNAGINDIALLGSSLATMQTNATNWINTATTAGYIPVISTLLPTAVAGYTPAMEVIRLAYNAWLLTQPWNVFDRASIPALSNPNNTTYYAADKEHLTPAGYLQVAMFEGPLMNALAA